MRPTDASFRFDLSGFARRSLRAPGSSFTMAVWLCPLANGGGDCVEDVERFCLWLIVWLIEFDGTASVASAACMDTKDALSNEFDDGSRRFSCINTAVGCIAIDWIDSVAFDRVSLVIGLFVGIWSAVVSLVAFINPKCIDCCLGIQTNQTKQTKKVRNVLVNRQCSYWLVLCIHN